MSVGDDLLRRGATRLQPGVYSYQGELHIDAEEMLAHRGLEPTDENLATLARAAAEMAAEHGIPTEIRDKRDLAG